jgi:hypothetical protein
MTEYTNHLKPMFTMGRFDDPLFGRHIPQHSQNPSGVIK